MVRILFCRYCNGSYLNRFKALIFDIYVIIFVTIHIQIHIYWYFAPPLLLYRHNCKNMYFSWKCCNLKNIQSFKCSTESSQNKIKTAPTTGDKFLLPEKLFLSEHFWHSSYLFLTQHQPNIGMLHLMFIHHNTTMHMISRYISIFYKCWCKLSKIIVFLTMQTVEIGENQL